MPGSTSARTACTTAPASSRASAATTPSAARRSSASPSTSSGSRTPAKLLYMELAVLGRRAAGRLPRDDRRRTASSECYLRPIAFYGYGELGVHTGDEPGRRRDHELAVGRLPRRGAARQQGIRAMISSWRRVGPNTIPHAAKATGVYLNSMLATHEARRAGYDEAIMLTDDGIHRRRPGRDDLRGQGRDDLHARPLRVDPARDHPRHDHPDRPGPRLHGRREAADPHRPLHRRRGLHGRHGGRGDAGALGRRPRDRRRAGHARAPEGLRGHGHRDERALGAVARLRRRRAKPA